MEHQVLDNECSAKYIRTITEDWKATYQLVPPDVHRRNLAERAIQTFKAHFLSILAGLSKAFPNYLWDKLLPQTELTLNLLRQATIAPDMSAWEFYNKAPFNFDATPIGPCGCPVIIHNKPNKRASWAFRGRDGFNIGPALSRYRCFEVVVLTQKLLSYRTQSNFGMTTSLRPAFPTKTEFSMPSTFSPPLSKKPPTTPSMRNS